MKRSGPRAAGVNGRGQVSALWPSAEIAEICRLNTPRAPFGKPLNRYDALRTGVVMRRRTFLAVVGGAAVWPVAAPAEQTKPVVGFLGSGFAHDQEDLVRATLQGLKEAGFRAGENFAIESRWANGQYERLPALAEELVRLPVSLIIAAGGSDPGRHDRGGR